MGTMTLVEFQKRVKDQLIAGIVEDIYTTSPIYANIPWIGYEGNGFLVNRESTIGDAQFLGIGGTITAKSPSAVDEITFRGTTVIGDAEINGQLSAESSSSTNDIVAQEISSKAKSVGRKIQSGIATGDGATPNMNSLHTLVDSAQYTPSNGVGGAVLTFEMLDALIDLVKAKDGIVDWLQMPGRELRKYRALLRGLGGTVPTIDVQMGAKTIKVNEFNGIPIFQNDFLSTVETDDGAALTGGAQSSIYAGVWDDGTKKIGASMIFPKASQMGISMEPIGAKETMDESIYRVKAYCNFAVFNRRGVARLTGIKAG